MGSGKLDKPKRTSVFLEESLIKEVDDYVGDNKGSKANVIRLALATGLQQLRHMRIVFQLKNNAIEAASAGKYVAAREAIDRMAIVSGRPSTDQLMEQMKEAVDKRDFARARHSLDRLELYLGDRIGTSPGLEEMEDALENEDFDIARKILVQLEENADSTELGV